MNIRFRKYWLILISLILFVVFISYAGLCEPVIIGKNAPAFNLQTLTGEDVFLNDYCGDGGVKKIKKVVLLSFWNSSCKHCIKEFELLNKLYDQYHEKGLEIFLVNIREKKDKINEIIDKNTTKIPVLLDIYGSVAERYGVQKTLPIMFLINKAKIIQYEHTGVINDKEEAELIKKIEELVK